MMEPPDLQIGPFKFWKIDPPIPWAVRLSYHNEEWRACWSHYSASGSSCWRAIRHVIVYRLVGRRLDPRELIPHWYRWLQGGE